MFTELICAASWPEPPRPDTAMKESRILVAFFPPCRKKKMVQGLNNSSHRGKYIGLNSLLGAASSRWVNMSDRQSLLHTFSVQTHKHAVKQATGSNKPAQGLFPYSHERTNCFSFFFSKQSINCLSDVVTFAPLCSQMRLPQSVFFASLTVSSAADKHISCCIFVYVLFASNRSVYCDVVSLQSRGTWLIRKSTVGNSTSTGIAYRCASPTPAPVLIWKRT